MSEHEALDPHEARAGRERHGDRARVRPRQDLDAERQRGGPVNRVADDSHRRHDFWTRFGSEVGAIVRVLDQQAIEPGIAIEARILDRLRDNR